MKKIIFMVCLILIVGLASGCDQSATAVNQDQGQVETAMEIKYSEKFKVDYLADGSKLISDGDNRQLLLIEKEKEAPEGYEDIPIVRIPIEKVIVTSETQASMLVPSQAINTIIGYTENVNDWYIEELKDNIANNKVTFLGTGDSPDFEKIKEVAPDLVILDAGLKQVGDKLDAIDVPYLVDSSDWEADPMGRMEWIKLFATFYNQEEQVIAYFDEGLKQLQDLKAKVLNLEKPKVLWGFLFTGKAFVPYAGSYVGEHINSAGGDYIFKDLGPDKPHTATITMEEFYAGGQMADVYISSGPPTYHSSSRDIVDRSIPIMVDIKPLLDDTTWCYQPWYYQVVHETPAMIEELQAILYPDLYPDYQDFKYYWKVPK